MKSDFIIETYTSKGKLEGKAEADFSVDALSFAKRESTNEKTCVITATITQKIYAVYINQVQILARI